MRRLRFLLDKNYAITVLVLVIVFACLIVGPPAKIERIELIKDLQNEITLGPLKVVNDYNYGKSRISLKDERFQHNFIEAIEKGEVLPSLDRLPIKGLIQIITVKGKETNYQISVHQHLTRSSLVLTFRASGKIKGFIDLIIPNDLLLEP